MSVSVQRTAATSSNPRRRDRLSLNQKSQGAHDLHHVQSDLQGTSRIVLGGGLTTMYNTVAFVVAIGESLPEILGFSKERSSADEVERRAHLLFQGKVHSLEELASLGPFVVELRVDQLVILAIEC